VVESFFRRKSIRDIKYIKQQSNNDKLYLEQIWTAYNNSVLDFYDVNKEKYKFVFLCSNDFIKDPKLLSTMLNLQEGDFTFFDRNRFEQLKKVKFFDIESRKTWRRLSDRK